MTRAELFDRYVADTLDEEATAELEALLTGDPEYSRQFAEDLLATGQFEEVGGEIRRVGEEDEAVAGPAPVARSMPPPSPPSPQPPIPYQGPARGPFFGEHHEQPVLKSAQQRSPVGLIAVVAVLLLGIAAAVYFGLTREPPAVEESEPVVALIDVAEGGVQLTRNLVKLPVEGGTKLFEGDVLDVSEGALRVAYVNERTYLHLHAGSQVRFEEHDGGKRLRLALGQLTAEAAPQPVGHPMMITTDHAAVTLLGTKVTVRARARETLVEVSTGEVKVERKEDGEQVEVPAGAWTMVGMDGPMYAWEFVAGVNLNGGKAIIDGKTWLSQADATQQGMEVVGIERKPEMQQAVEPPTRGVPEAGVREVLMTSVAAKSDRLVLKWPQPNGQYQVLVWIMEHEGNQIRSLRLNLEEKLVAEELGKKQNLGEWNRFGPYPATVTDGALDILMSADASFQSHDPHLSGLAVYRRLGGTPVPAAETSPEEQPAPEGDLPEGEEPPSDEPGEDLPDEPAPKDGTPTEPSPAEPPARLPDLEDEGE